MKNRGENSSLNIFEYINIKQNRDTLKIISSKNNKNKNKLFISATKMSKRHGCTRINHIP